ncbi:MAG: antibiotic biosynthesis monooxygenase [Bacteroidales bacterium]|nr:antibiotic biosynthesis monooxygenase [Bacteroidales bacterium]
MIVTCVHVKVRTENIQDFIEAITDNHKGSVHEPGNLRFDVLQQADDPARFMIYEAYESEEDVRMHKETAHYIKWRDTVKGYMAEERYGIRYNVVEPSDRSMW